MASEAIDPQTAEQGARVENKENQNMSRMSGRFHKLVLSATLVTVVSGFTGTPAAAASAVTLTNGTGLETHVGVPFQPSPPCAHYHTYQAEVVFEGASAVTTATITSGTTAWDEGPDGSHELGEDCGDTAGSYPVGGFKVVLTGGVNCVDSSVTYRRAGTVITLEGVNGDSGDVSTPCGLDQNALTYTIGTVTNGSTTVTLCNSPIAPQACVISPPKTL